MRILTATDRAQHIVNVRARNNGWPKDDESANLVGDIATTETNRFHCDLSGLLCWLPDTPQWIIEMATRRQWHTPGVRPVDVLDGKTVA